MTPRETTKLLVRLNQVLENWLDKVIPTGDHTLHIVLLVLNGTQQHRVGQVVHFRYTPTRRTKQNTLRLGRALNDVIRGPQKLSDELRLVAIKGPLEVRC